MAKQNIKLTKNIISNKYSNNIHSKDFNKLAKSKENIDNEKIRDIYHDVFYSIPKKGNLSHISIVKRTYDYLFNSENQQLNQQIDNLVELLSELNDALIATQSPSVPEDPRYPNGSFLIAGENGVKYPGLHTIYVMQEGLKRAIDNDGNIYELVRRANNLPYAEDDPLKFGNKYYLTVDELNSIPDGKRITVASDLTIIGNALKADFEDITLRYSSYKLRLKCIGLETEDAADLLLLDQDFYLSGGCVIQYVKTKPKEAFQNTVDDYIPEVTTLNMFQGQVATINVGKNPLTSANDGIPNNIEYPLNTPVQFNNSDISNYIKNWGEGFKYEGIINVQGRVQYQQLENEYVTDPNPPDYQILNGLPSSFSLALGPPGNELSVYGTKMIYPAGTNLHGDQGQESGVQEIFNDPNNIYYHPFFYGQPIIRYDNDYLIFFNGFKGNVGPINVTSYAFLSLGKKEANTSDYPYGHAAIEFYEADYHSEISYTGIPQDTDFQNSIKDQIRIYRGNKIDDFFPDEGDKPINWSKVKNEGRIKHYGVADIGTIGYSVVAPLKGTSNAFQVHNSFGPPSFPSL